MPRRAGRCPSPEATGRLRHGLPDRGARAGFPTALETVPSCFGTSSRSTPEIRRVPRSDSAAPTAADAARQVASPPPDSPGVALPRSRSSRRRRSRHAVQSVNGHRNVTPWRLARGGNVATGAGQPAAIPAPLTFIADRASHTRGPQRGLLVTALRDAALHLGHEQTVFVAPAAHDSGLVHRSSSPAPYLGVNCGTGSTGRGMARVPAPKSGRSGRYGRPPRRRDLVMNGRAMSPTAMSVPGMRPRPAGGPSSPDPLRYARPRGAPRPGLASSHRSLRL